METTRGTDAEDLVALLRSGSAPREIRIFAARGLLPLDPDDSLRALLAVLRDPDPETSAEARRSFQATSPDRLARFVESGAAVGEEIDLLARGSDDPFVLEEVVRSRAVADETLVFLAATATGRPQEALIANQARLLAQPKLFEALLQNPTLTTDGRRLLAELKEEFFEKEVRRRESRAPSAEETVPAPAGPSEASAVEDLEDLPEGEGLGEEGESLEAAEADATPDSEEESLFIGALYRRIGLMTIHQKIDLAYKGSKEERRILIGDTNKLIGIAVLKSRALSVNEVESFAAMRNLDEEIYRRIAQSREWMRKPAVVLALVRNPRTPLDISLPLLKRLPVRELRAVFRDRNLASGLRASARRFLVLKRR